MKSFNQSLIERDPSILLDVEVIIALQRTSASFSLLHLEVTLLNMSGSLGLIPISYMLSEQSAEMSIRSTIKQVM